jgi:hypothetical protein
VEWVKASLDRLAKWADGQGVRIDLHGAEILLGLIDDLGPADLGELGPAELRGLLLEDLPDQVAAGPGEAEPILAAFGSLVDFFAATDEVSAEQAAALRAELAGLGADLAEALEEAGSDDQNAVAEVLFKMMRDDGVDLDSKDAVAEWIQAFERLSDEEKALRTGPYLAEALEALDEMLLPPVRLAPEAELAEAARESRLLVDAVKLADQVAEGELTGDGALSDEAGRLWDAAVAAELIVVSEGTARPGSMLASVKAGDREALLDTWVTLLDDAVSLDHEDHDHVYEEVTLTVEEAVRDALPGVLLHLYEQEGPTSRAVLVDALSEHLTQAFDVFGKEAREWREAGAEAFDQELADLMAWGVVEGDESGYELTPLGLWGVRELLLADGYIAPVVGELAGQPADVLVAGLAAHRADTAEEEIDLWLAGREPEEAARELLRAMAEGTTGTRNLATAVLSRLPAKAAPAVREGLEVRETRPYAALWLQQHGDESVTLTPAELTWLFIDTVAGLLETTEPAVAVASALADAPAEADLGAMIEDMWRADHPDVAEVLEALGDHHPDRDLAKAARRAAYKSRS